MRIAYTTLKTAVVAPMPSAREITAVKVNPGILMSCRTVYRRSCITVFIEHFLQRDVSGQAFHWKHKP